MGRKSKSQRQVPALQNNQSSQSDDQKTRVASLLFKQAFDERAKLYIANRYRDKGDHDTADSPWKEIPTRSVSSLAALRGCGPAWYLPSYEIFLDCTKLLCQHMSLYGLEELLLTGADNGDLLNDFWRFEDPSLLYNALFSLVKVVRKYLVIQIYGNSEPRKDSFHLGDLAKWLEKPSESTHVLWTMFERTATSLLNLFEANMSGSFELHCAAVQKILRVFIHAWGHPIYKLGFIDVLVPYTMHLASVASRTEDSDHFASTRNMFPRRFWAFWERRYGHLNVDLMFQTHFANRSKIELVQDLPCDDSWLLASDELYVELFERQVEEAVSMMYIIGTNPQHQLAHFNEDIFTKAIESDNDVICTQAIEAMIELDFCRPRNDTNSTTTVPLCSMASKGNHIQLLHILLSKRLCQDYPNRNITSIVNGSYQEAWKGLSDLKFSKRFSVQLIYAILIGISYFSQSSSEYKDLSESPLFMWFIVTSLDCNLPEVCERAAFILTNVLSSSMSRIVMSVLLPRVASQLGSMMQHKRRGLTITFAAIKPLLEILQDRELNIPMLPNLTADLTRSILPILLNEFHGPKPSLGIFGSIWRSKPPYTNGVEAHLVPEAGGAINRKYDKGEFRKKVLSALYLLVLRDPEVLGGRFVVEGGLSEFDKLLRKLRTKDVVATIDLFEVLEKLVSCSIEIVKALFNFESLVMLLAVCVCNGDEDFKMYYTCARNVITAALNTFDEYLTAAKGGCIEPLQQKSFGVKTLKLALESETASRVRMIMALPNSLDQDGVLKPDLLRTLELGPRPKFIDSQDLLSKSDDGEFKESRSMETKIQAAMVCAGCGAMEIEKPHSILDVQAMSVVSYCSPACQRDAWAIERKRDLVKDSNK